MKLIKKVVLEVNKTNSEIVSGVVQNINQDGTVDIVIPPDITVLTGIPNQTPFELKVGDSVKLLKERNRLSNVWVIAKCGLKNGSYTIKDSFTNSFKEISGYNPQVSQVLSHDENGDLLWVDRQ